MLPLTEPYRSQVIIPLLEGDLTHWCYFYVVLFFIYSFHLILLVSSLLFLRHWGVGVWGGEGGGGYVILLFLGGGGGKKHN